MTKIAYNNCFGGFTLSRAAVLRAREISENPNWGGTCTEGDVYENGMVLGSHHGYVNDVPRHDPVLIQVIEELGDAANGAYASLCIEDVPAGTAYRIDEYDGNESVMTLDDYDWQTA
jgi:hypothetical protein